jgi:hypothetical protein
VRLPPPPQQQHNNNCPQQQASKKAAALASQPERKGDNGKYTLLLADDIDEGSSVLLDTKI